MRMCDPIRVLLLLIGVYEVFSVDVRSDPAVFGVVGEYVKLRCSFSSHYPVSSHITVDWSYRPEDGGPTITIFHFQSMAYPSLEGPFKNRIKWEGDVTRGDASISLQDLRLTDNGTLTCTVRNSPDVHGNFPQTKLTVTLKSIHFKFSTTLLLSIMVFIPSVLVVLVLLIRMRGAIKRDLSRGKNPRKKSPIEESKECVCDNHGSNTHHLCGSSSDQMSPFCRRCQDISDSEYGGDPRT
ncbi:myelin protein zero-like protein 3 [Discoglossus pictus]